VELYKAYKEKIANKSTDKWGRYQVYMDASIANKIKEFIPSSE